MESECIHGEGIDFIFPDPDCNPFYSSEDEQKLGIVSSSLLLLNHRTDDKDFFEILCFMGVPWKSVCYWDLVI